MTTITKRSELLFLYDITNANPNGDPNDENKPRIDEETGKNIVTDVRLKRTIRDYLNEAFGQDIFVREIKLDDGTIQDAKTRAKDFGKKKEEIIEAVLGQCIDVRLFGATMPLDNDSVTWTGPVQFKMGQSLHAVKQLYIKGTGAFASKPKAKQKTFREEYVLAYSLIAFHGIINEQAAKHTWMSDADEELLLKAIWNGTKGLISRSKFGQMPRLLLKVTYTEPHFFIGDLDRLISLESEKIDEEIRGPQDYRIELGTLIERFELNAGKIESISFVADPGLTYCVNGGLFSPEQFWTPMTL